MTELFPSPSDPLAHDVQDNALSSTSNEQMFILNYGTRLLTAFTDKEILVDIALDTLADFARGERVALMSLDPEKKRLCVEGVYSPAGMTRPKTFFPIDGTVIEKRLAQKVMSVAPLVVVDDVPLPAENAPAGDHQCLCLPLVGASFRVVGLATIEIPQAHPFTFLEQQELKILSVVLAVSLDNADLFARIISDSLTHLYTRRFYDIRVEEELAKLKRNGGCLSVILLDLDHFKAINDVFGHLTGDDVLRQFGTLLKENVRKGSTLVSRYGGEEFILLLPGAHLDEALTLANRIKDLCVEHNFGDENRPVHVTVSGGVAVTDDTESISPQELFQRADTALYSAKRDGRNRVAAWTIPKTS